MERTDRTVIVPGDESSLEKENLVANSLPIAAAEVTPLQTVPNYER